MALVRFIRDLIARREGNVAIISALAMPMVVGGAALGVDTIYWYFRDLELQAAADAGAWAAAIEMRAGRGELTIAAAAAREAAGNGFDPAVGVMTLNTPPATGDYVGPKAVEVVLTERQDRFFSGLFDDSTVRAHARAVAIYETASNACIVALDPGASAALSMSGNASLSLAGCNIMANSIAADAVSLGGASRLEAPCVISGGGVSASAGLTLTDCRVPIVSAPPVADPFAHLPAPESIGPCLNGNAPVLLPGRYCNGLNLQGDVHLAPGVYVLEGGDFRANAQARITGEGVTIYLADGVGTRFNGTAQINLSAPTEGPYAGVLFYADREAADDSHVFNGTADSSLTGALYFASQSVQYAGNFSGANGCTQIVARTVSWTGSSDILVNCEAAGMGRLPAMQLIKIVE